MRRVASGVGELLLTAGAVLLLFGAYQLVWTNVEAERAQAQVTRQLEERWRRAPAGTTEPAGTGAGTQATAAPRPLRPPPRPAPGDPVALLHIPRLGDGWRAPIVEGVAADQLASGVGHYPGTAAPGEIGNFAVAGHRVTNGQPFRNLDRLRRGDAVIVETAENWLTYVVEDSQVVAPTRREVLLPVPDQVGVEATRARMTLTTCHPRWSSQYRLVVYTRLQGERDKDEGRPPALGA